MAEPLELNYASQQPPTGVPMGLRIMLSLMMFLQYAIWGAWWVVLGIYLRQIGFSGAEIGMVYGTMAIASIFSPMIFGQIADRWVSTQYLLAGLHLVGAVVLAVAIQLTDFWPFYIAVLLYALLYIPTISLTNSLCFHHVPDAAKHFPGIRVFGTIGWIVAGLVVGAALLDTTVQPIYLAVSLSFVMGFLCLFLPDTPPTGKAGDALAFVKAFGLLRDPTFSLFIFTSFLISIVLAGYYAFAGPFLTDIDIERIAPVASIMTIGQFTEMILLPFLPFFIRWLGMKWVLVLGMAAWGLRYGIFSIGDPLFLIVFGIALHGVCYDFFFVAAYIHVDNQATREIRASAQAFFNLVTMGLGMWLGNMFFGWLVDNRTDQVTEAVDWSNVWLLPAAAVVIVLVIFIAGFREKPKGAAAEVAAEAVGEA